MNKEQQEKIDAQLAKGNRDPEAYRPRIVSSSGAPVLSEAWLLEEDSATVTVEIHVIGGKRLALEAFQVEVVRGLTLMQTLAIQEALEAYPIDPRILKEGYTPTREERVELQKRHNIRRRATIAQAIVNPAFSFNGEGEGIAIDGRSESLVATLYDAYEVVNIPGKQVQFQNRFPNVGGDPDGEGADVETTQDGEGVRLSSDGDTA